jgi:hypothetical protein
MPRGGGAIGAMLKAAEKHLVILVDGFIMTVCALLTEHLFNSAFQLAVATIDIILGSVIHFDIGIERCILAEHAAHIATAHLRNTKYHTVLQGLPPNGSHSTSYWGTNQLSYLKLLINPWETMTVTIIVLAHKHARWLYPLVIGVGTYIFAMRNKVLILLTAEQGAQIIVQPAATIMTLIYNSSNTVAVLVAK